MYKELLFDIDGFIEFNYGMLMLWVEQGVLLFNIVLIVEQGKVYSYVKWGWEIFIDKVIDVVNEYC